MKTLKLIRCAEHVAPQSGNRASSTPTVLTLVKPKSTSAVSRTMGRGLEVIIPIIAAKLKQLEADRANT